MFESAFLIRWSLSVVVIVLLLIAFYLALKVFKQKGFDFKKFEAVKPKNKKMQIVETLFIDSKTKLVKIKDQDQLITVLVGQGSVVTTQKIKKEKVEDKNV